MMCSIRPHITRYNQLVVLDIDHGGERELERITPLATEAPYTVAYFRSPSGDGAKLIAYPTFLTVFILLP